jgi:hypothetical protein
VTGVLISHRDTRPNSIQHCSYCGGRKAPRLNRLTKLVDEVGRLLEQIVDFVALDLEILDVQIDVLADDLEAAPKLDEASLERLTLETIGPLPSPASLGRERT